MKIESVKQLREHYIQPSGRAVIKELAELDKHCIHFLQKSPFMVLSSVSKDGKQDASPRGGKPGFAKVLNSKQVLLADARGNNRLDSLTNIVETGETGALFFIPGIQETLRINGQAEIRTDEDLIALFTEEQNQPKTCILITIECIFLHCAKALMRSDLWGDTFKINQADFPSMGQMLKDQLKTEDEVESRDEMVKRYKGDL
jgi:PPOX class probable FMN-dependent enzyme